VLSFSLASLEYGLLPSELSRSFAALLTGLAASILKPGGGPIGLGWLTSVGAGAGTSEGIVGGGVVEGVVISKDASFLAFFLDALLGASGLTSSLTSGFVSVCGSDLVSCLASLSCLVSVLRSAFDSDFVSDLASAFASILLSFVSDFASCLLSPFSTLDGFDSFLVSFPSDAVCVGFCSSLSDLSATSMSLAFLVRGGVL
jgi:hypothetical protein